MDNTCNEAIAAFRVVQTTYERNVIPCNERVRGMLVVVVEIGYRTFQLQGEDYCNNNNWKDVTIDNSFLTERVGHKTEKEPKIVGILTDNYFNENYPKALEGFQVTVESLNTTFMKVSDNRWVMIGSFKYLADE